MVSWISKRHQDYSSGAGRENIAPAPAAAGAMAKTMMRHRAAADANMPRYIFARNIVVVRKSEIRNRQKSEIKSETRSQIIDEGARAAWPMRPTQMTDEETPKKPLTFRQRGPAQLMPT